MAGIYKSDSLSIALVRQPKGIRSYAAVVLPPGNETWRPNDIIFELVSRGSGKYEMIDYANWEQQPFDTLTVTKSWNGLSAYGWQKANAETTPLPQKAPAFADLPDNKPFFKVLDDSTGYLRINSMMLENYPSIDSVVNRNDEYIRKNNRLIIDLRGCDSGSYKLAERLRPLLYTQPVRLVGDDFYATPDNVAAWRKGLEDQTTRLPNEYVDQIKEVLQQSAGVQGRLVSMGPDENMILPSPLAKPEKVAVIIDEQTRETAEQLLLEVRQSQKVKLFGVPTAGMVDYSHGTSIKYFSPDFFLVYPVTRSRRIPMGQSIDNKGVVPDFILDYSQPGWLYEVQKKL
jgi:C-terminal processing protease CtpA/Prc